MKINNKHILYLIHDFVEGKLSEQNTDTLWAHLITNPADLEYLQTLATLKKMGQDGAFSTYDNQQIQENDSRLFQLLSPSADGGYTWYYLAAAAVLIFGFAILFSLPGDTESVAEFGPIAMIEFNIERSADALTDLEIIINRAISHSSAGNPDVALELLNSIQTEHISRTLEADIELMKGAVHYNAGAFEEAGIHFQNAIQKNPDKLTLEKAYWYLANAQLQLGMDKDAIQNIMIVIEADGAFLRIASIALENLQAK